MIPVRAFEGRTVAVFGLARSGLTAARALVAGGARVACWDDGEAGRQAAEAEGLPLVDLREADWSTFSALVLSPASRSRIPPRTGRWSGRGLRAWR